MTRIVLSHDQLADLFGDCVEGLTGSEAAHIISGTYGCMAFDVAQAYSEGKITLEQARQDLADLLDK